MEMPIVTVFTVCRGSVSLGRYFESQPDAFVELHRIEASMRDAMLEPNVWLGQAKQQTSYSELRPVDR